MNAPNELNDHPLAMLMYIIYKTNHPNENLVQNGNL